MPTYEYRCDKCGKRFALVHSMAWHSRKHPSCPKCRSARVTQLFSPFHAQTAKKS
jgi:putative FmdB family regulatory protein